jgi:hypothetical protein
MPQVATPREERQNPTTRWSGAVGASLRRDHVTGPRAADRPASVPASLAATGPATVTAPAAAAPGARGAPPARYAARVLAAGAGDVRSVPGTGELHAGLDEVL